MKEEVRFGRDRILSLLARLSERLGARGLRGEILLFGGAAMLLGWNAREATRDIDAVFVPAEEIRKIVREIAREEGLPEGWLNDGVKGFLGDAEGGERERRPVFSSPHLDVYVPAPEYLLAMKAMAARSGPEFEDAADLRLLVGALGLAAPEDALRIVERYFPRGRIPAKTRFFVEAVFEEIEGLRG